MNPGYVYIMTNNGHTVLYTGVTNDLVRRVAEHKAGVASAFTTRYRCTQLLFFESAESIIDAIAREKQIKNRPRQWKEEMINKANASWRDLSTDIGVTNALVVEVKRWYEARSVEILPSAG